MRVGILTMYYGNISHGGLLQAFSLCETIKSFGYDSEQIQYDYNLNFIDNSPVHKLKRWIRQIPRRAIQTMVHDNSRKAYFDYMDIIPHSKYYTPDTINSIAEAYDCFVVGSDQVWNDQYCDDSFYFPFANGKKIAYAASVGKDILEESEKAEIGAKIKDFSAISVREKGLTTSLKSVYSNEISHVCDPVFLQSASFWRGHAICPEIPSRYTLLYILGNNDEERSRSLEFAKSFGKPIVVVPNVNLEVKYKDLSFGDIQVWNIGPKEFLGLIDKAETVLTDSFHCAAFSTIFNKELYCFSRPNKGFSMNSRITSLLGTAGIPERYVDIYSEMPRPMEEINYIEANKKMSSFAKQSKDWLMQVLSE